MKRQLMLTVAIMLLACGCMAQNTKPANTNGKANSGQVFDVVEEMPQYPGGMEALMSYLGENMKYPADAEKNKIEGRVIISFVIDKEGNVKDAEVVRSVSPSIDAEALRVVNGMPQWIPGKQKGKPVNVKYTLPLSFRLK